MFQQMRYFIAVVEAHSFTKAADNANISQSAISQQIHALENTLGIQLIRRVGRSFKVTPAGEYFYAHSKNIIESVQELTDKTIQIASDDKALLRVGYIQNFGSSEFLQAVADFSQQFPEVDLKISNGTHEHLYELLKQNQVDLIFNDQRRALSDQYVNEALVSTQLFVLVAKHALPDATNQVEVESLGELPCILVVNQDQRTAEEAYYRDILGVNSQFIFVTSNDEAEMLVASNQGFLLVTEHNQTRINPAIGRTLELVHNKRPMVQSYYAFWKQDNSGYYIETFADILKQQFESHD